MPVIFISYRRSDSQDVTGRIYDRLVGKFTHEQVLKDVDNIPLGVSFPMHLKQLLTKANVVLVIIGPNWINATDKQGKRRLDDPNDFVRVEVETALRKNMPVIPILVSNAQMPSTDELPSSIQALAARNGMAVRPDPDFNNDISRLFSGIEKLEKLLKGQTAKPKPDAAPVANIPMVSPRDLAAGHQSAPEQAQLFHTDVFPSRLVDVVQRGSPGRSRVEVDREEENRNAINRAKIRARPAGMAMIVAAALGALVVIELFVAIVVFAAGRPGGWGLGRIMEDLMPFGCAAAVFAPILVLIFLGGKSLLAVRSRWLVVTGVVASAALFLSCGFPPVAGSLDIMFGAPDRPLDKFLMMTFLATNVICCCVNLAALSFAISALVSPPVRNAYRIEAEARTRTAR